MIEIRDWTETARLTQEYLTLQLILFPLASGALLDVCNFSRTEILSSFYSVLLHLLRTVLSDEMQVGLEDA